MIVETTVEDLEGVTDIAQWYFYRCNLPGTFDKRCFLNAWKTFLESKCGIILRRVVTGRVCEAIGLMLYPDPNDGKQVASAVFWYAPYPSAGIANGILFAEVERALRERGVQRFYMTALYDDRREQVGAFFLKAGFTPSEIHYTKIL